MIDSFDDFCLYMYVIVDDVMQQIASLLKRRANVVAGTWKRIC
jgi:hypothetical protein